MMLPKREVNILRFNIPVGNPRLETTRDYKDIDAFGAIESIFVMNTENVIINWNS